MILARAVRASKATTRLVSLRTFSASLPRNFVAEEDEPQIQQNPNPTMEKDPSLMLLLRDVDSALKKNTSTNSQSSYKLTKSPQVTKQANYDELSDKYLDEHDELDHENGEFDLQRKAPAAVVGGIRARALNLPYELIQQMKEILEGAIGRHLASRTPV